MSEDSRITLLEQQLAESALHPSEKAVLADDLSYAQTINGSPDPIMQGLKRLTLSGVRRELATHEREAKHYAVCPVASKIKKDDQGNLIMPWEQGQAGTEFSLSWKEGLKAKGAVAWAAVMLAVVGAAIYGITSWQRAETLDDVKTLIQAQQPALEQHVSNN